MTNNTETQPWYATRCLFRDEQKGTYEERTILIQAASQEEAVRLAEDDARDYASNLGLIYEQYVDTFHLFDETIESGTEIFSLIREVHVNGDEYIDRYLDDGTERRTKIV